MNSALPTSPVDERTPCFLVRMAGVVERHPDGWLPAVLVLVWLVGLCASMIFDYVMFRGAV